MRFILCEKQFLYLNTTAYAVIPRHRCGDIQVANANCYTTLFFQHHSKLKTMKLVTPMISTNIFFRKNDD